MGLLSRKPKAEGEGFETDGALFLFFGRVVARYDRQRCVDHGGERVGV
jgi:hypothetical protein